MDTEMIKDLLDDDKVLALYLSVMYYSELSKRAETTPAGSKAILTMADQFVHWLKWLTRDWVVNSLLAIKPSQLRFETKGSSLTLVFCLIY